MQNEDDDDPASHGEGRQEDELANQSVPQDRPPVARWGLIWAVTPVGVLHFDTHRLYLPFLRVAVPCWYALGEVYDAIPRAIQRQLEADGIGRQAIEEPLLLAYFQALSAAAR